MASGRSCRNLKLRIEEDRNISYLAVTVSVSISIYWNAQRPSNLLDEQSLTHCLGKVFFPAQNLPTFNHGEYRAITQFFHASIDVYRIVVCCDQGKRVYNHFALSFMAILELVLG